MNIRESAIDLSSAITVPPIVLAVDDSADTLNRLCEGISAAGYAILMAGDGVEALKHLEFIAPDAILIDAVSPDTGGFELARRIKAVPAWADIPVLFMVELANSEQIIRSFENGGSDYLSKPLRVPEVLARLTTRIAARIEPKETVAA
jgi:DNA-binding response OmpR family regulator